MGFGGIGIWQLLIILVIVVLLFGTKKIRNIGGDLGGALKSFRSAMKDGQKKKEEEPEKLSHEEGDAAVQDEMANKEKEKV